MARPKVNPEKLDELLASVDGIPSDIKKKIKDANAGTKPVVGQGSAQRASIEAL